MDISSFTSNIQLSSLFGGTNIAGALGKQADQTSIQETAINTVNKENDVELLQQAEPLSRAEATETVPTEQEFEVMLEQLQQFIDSNNIGLSFRVDSDTGKNVITLYEAKSGDIIKQFPSTEMLMTLKRLADHSTGFVVENV